MTGRDKAERFDVVVIGAGFSGLYMLHKLRSQGFRAVVLEAADGVGGTWRHNRYPGARCDVKSFDYSFSFDDGLQTEWVWSEKYATQPEILRYANHVADRLDLRRDIRFNTRVKTARFDETRGRWDVETEDGARFDTQFYIIATGCLSVPKAVDIEGHESFKGRSYHSTNWPEGGVDFTGLRVGVIGTGSSAIQTIPIVAAQAKDLTVFQRTAAYAVPAFNRPTETAERDAWIKTRHEHRAQARASQFGTPDVAMDRPTFSVSAEERQEIYEEAWKRGELAALLMTFNDVLFDEAANDAVSEFVRGKIRSIVKDPETAETLCPKSFPLGTKRVCLDTNYYQTFNKPNVHLVDLRKTPIERVTPNGIKTSDREYEFDAIIYATGFDAMTGAIVSVDVRGRGGVELKKKWEDGPKTYLGLTVSGFPNLFMITGPGSPSVMCNMMSAIEQHVEWISDCLADARQRGIGVIEAQPDAEAGWVAHVNEVADATLFPRANSWYMGANVPGKPRIYMPYIGGLGPYREICTSVAAKGYLGFAQESARETATA